MEHNEEKYNIVCVYINKKENKVAMVKSNLGALPEQLPWKDASSMKRIMQKIVNLLSSMIYTVSEEDVNEIIGYYNEKLGKNLRPKTYRSLIEARFREGYEVEDFKTVIDNKASEWLNNPKMASNLKPTTLFRPCRFDEYLNSVKYVDPNKLKREPTYDAEKMTELMKTDYFLNQLEADLEKEAERIKAEEGRND